MLTRKRSSKSTPPIQSPSQKVIKRRRRKRSSKSTPPIQSPSQKEIDLLSDPFSPSVTFYTVQVGEWSMPTYKHEIFFKNGRFTWDGKTYHNESDEASAPFLKSLKNNQCPDEFKAKGDGTHMILKYPNRDWEEMDRTEPKEPIVIPISLVDNYDELKKFLEKLDPEFCVE